MMISQSHQRGLSNNTFSRCYINSVMQFIFHNPLFFQLLQNNSEFSEFCHDKELLTDVLHKLYCKDKRIDLTDQDVSSDFLHWCCDKFNRNSSFTFKSRQTRVCCGCGESFSQLMNNTVFQIYPTSSNLVDSIIDSLSAQIDWKCIRCGIVKADITFDFITFPNDLFIAFHQDHSKKNSTIQPDIYINDVRYILMGCIEHTGSVDGGHYKAYMNFSNNWFCYNDLKVMPIKIKTIQQKCNGKSSFVCFWYAKYT